MKYEEYAPIVLRISIALVILWFGLVGVFNYESLVGYLPEFAYSLPISPNNLVILNGVLEIILGTLLIVGFFTRIVAFILFLHILVIAIGLGYNDVAIRDYGLAFATLAIFLNGPDKWCLDMKLRNKF
jgi:uncharacterized membrane protein YphA (DoxX/SURF4 family)|tara:strand:- start:2538 stop:2921 length:384 start_codon:yes stop_codon:yes gene_type:complete